ncbi:MAG: CRISPR-associated endonuclease Cas3'', partial [Acidimicrobiia bacterium]
VRPGMAVILDVAAGGYSPRWGWDPKSKGPVAEVADETLELASDDQGVGEDPLTYTGGRWVTLAEHLADVEAGVQALFGSLDPSGLNPAQCQAAAMAGRLHDLGKAHPCFQEMLLGSEPDDHMREGLLREGPWAKSARQRGPRNHRRYFRHELASALALLDTGRVALEGVTEPDLCLYLIAAHHGRVRLGFRPLPDEHPENGTIVALGVRDGETLPAVLVPGAGVPAATLDLSVMGMGEVDGRPSWSARMLALRDRPDLGPFRLAFLEAVVRLADWRASASYQETGSG